MGIPQSMSFANKIRTAVKEVLASGREASTINISLQAKVMTGKDQKRMLNALCDMTNAGELARVRPGVYALAAPRGPENKNKVMWRLLRMRRRVTVDDLVEMAEVKELYAEEWLRTLARRGVVRKDGKAFHLLLDTVEPPELTDNADKIRALREKKKQAAAIAMEAATKALGVAMQAINEL